MVDFEGSSCVNAAPTSTILDVPPEVIRKILRESCISVQDLANLSQTCSKIHSMLNDECNDIWRIKHQKRWPDVSKDIFQSGAWFDWRSQCVRGVQISCLTIKLLKKVWPETYTESEICYSHYDPFLEIMDEHCVHFFYMKDALMNLINGSDECSDLTLKFHAKQLMYFLRQKHLKIEWSTFKSLPPEEQLLEKGATLVAQWCQPCTDVTHDAVGAKLNKLADEVLEYMKSHFPEHPVHDISDKNRCLWREKRLANNVWDRALCVQIIGAIGEVLFKEKGFRANRESYHVISNSYINEVLECRLGVPLTLNIIFEAIARRLGIRLDPFFQGHFVLLWKKNYLDDPHGTLAEDFYLDVTKGYPYLRKADSMAGESSSYSCPFRASHIPKGSTTPIEVVKRLAGSVEVAGRLSMRSNRHGAGLRSPLELLVVIDPENLDYVLHLARFYMLYNISVKQLADHVQKLIESGQLYHPHHAENVLKMLNSFAVPQYNQPFMPLTMAHRSGVLFAVGMTMSHLLFGYKCVIFGWDQLCAASDEWKVEMGVHRLKLKDNQPFYNVLVEDGTYRYAAQENLEPLMEHQDSMAMLTLTEIGRYFEAYRGMYFEPNHMKQQEYPDDVLVRKQFYGPLAV